MDLPFPVFLADWFAMHTARRITRSAEMRDQAVIARVAYHADANAFEGMLADLES
jgi:hypothetical protein